MLRLLGFLLVGVFVGVLGTSQALAQKMKVLVNNISSGSVADEALMKGAPQVITSAKGLEKVWKAWRIDDKMPKIDFDKLIVVGVYSVGSKLNLAGATIDEKGNLDVLGMGTLDIAPGFRFVLGTVSKEGVKTVNGKQLPKE